MWHYQSKVMRTPLCPDRAHRADYGSREIGYYH